MQDEHALDLKQTIDDSHQGMVQTRKEPYLVVLIGKDAGRRFGLKEGQTTIGRSADADVTLDDDRVSRIHSMIWRRDASLVLQDCGSRNGTMVDGRTIDRCALGPASEIQLGRSVLHVEYRNPSDVEMEEALLEMALTDPLTGILNRHQLEQQAIAALAEARSSRAAVGLVMLDIDHFKQINDRLGHPAGDRVLKHVADMLREHIRDGDLLGRYGGDELVVVLTGRLSLDGARGFCERVRQAVAETALAHEGQDLQVTLSLGLCHAPSSAVKDFQSLVAMADKALYRAKEGGRNRVEVEPFNG